MKQLLLLVVFAIFVATVAGAHKADEVNISGAWTFSVDLDNGGHGDPTFVFKQDKAVLTGTYDGPVGQHAVNGTVKGNKAEFGFEFKDDDGETHKATYNGTIDSSTKMTGTVNFSGGPGGKWTATKK
jgi:hypothetical protein